MGNCMETCSELNQQNDTEKQQQQQQQQLEEEKASGFVKESGVRVKVVLTKEELEWLMFQLENRRDKRLEDILEEIKRGRSVKLAEQGWKPSLESILESPELLEMDR